MKAYTEINGTCIVGDKVYPPGGMSIFQNDNNVLLRSSDGAVKILDETDVTTIEKENGTFYADVPEFISENGAFFGAGSGSSVSIDDADGNPVTVQNPLPTNQNRVFGSDVWTNESVTTNWTDLDGTGQDVVLIPFTNLHTAIERSAGDTDTLLIHFKDTVQAHQIGLGCADHAGKTFSNVKIELLGSGGTMRTVKDDTANDEKYTSKDYAFKPQKFNAIQLTFDTADAVTLTNIIIFKSVNVSAQIQGAMPDGELATASLSGFKNLKVAIEEVVSDAFGRQKVALPTSLLDSIIEHDMENMFVDYMINGAGTVSFDDVNNVVDMNVTASGDYALIETIANGKYQPGKALEFVASTQMTSETGITKRCGYCTVRKHDVTATNVIQNGIYFENASGVISFNIVKNSVVTERVLQADWNVDVLDGEGASGFDFDPAYVQLPYIDLQFLAVGTVRVGFNINGKDVIVHKFYHANTADNTSTYMHTANLPVHYSIQSTGGAGSTKAIGYSVSSSGGFDALGKLNFIYDDDITINTGDTAMIVGMRLKDEFYNAFVEIISASVIATGSANFRWMLLLDPTYTGTVTWVDEPDSAIQVAKHNGNELITEGYKITAGYGSDRTRQAGNTITNSLRLAKKLNGDFIEIWLVVYAITGDDFHGVINYKDLF